MSYQNHSTIYDNLAQSFNHGQAADRTSSKYCVVNTMDVVDNLRDRGFLLDSFTGAFSSKITDRSGKHRVIMVNPDIKVGEDGTCARIVMQNSYDGLSRFQILAGMFRFACSNGLVIGQVGDVSQVSSKHVEGIYEAIAQIDQYLDKLPQMSKLVGMYRDVDVADELQAQLALQMAVTRQKAIWSTKFDQTKFAVKEDTMLEALRTEDTANDAWTIFNVLQEKVVNGGYDYNPNGKKFRTAKALKNPYTIDKVNQALFADYNQVLAANV